MTQSAPGGSASARCRNCGAVSSARFCRECGTPAAASPGACARCGHALLPGNRFCPGCGAATAASPAALSGNERLLWFGAGGITVAVIFGVILGMRAQQQVPAAAPDAPFATSAAPGTAPDISNLSPRERFNRLFDRVMRAAENGDEATVTNFAPMALGAYAMLDSIDADARYHAALIDLHTGNIDGARALGDSILKAEPGHLFGYVVRGTIARFEKKDAALKQVYRDFLQHYPAETKRARPEYQDHPKALEEFHAAAQAATR